MTDYEKCKQDLKKWHIFFEENISYRNGVKTYIRILLPYQVAEIVFDGNGKYLKTY